MRDTHLAPFPPGVKVAALRITATAIPPEQTWPAPAPGAARQSAIKRRRRAIDRFRSVSADMLLRRLLGHDAIYEDSGRPLDPTGKRWVSATHDGTWILAALGPDKVGIDVVDISRAHIVPDSAFTPSEREYLTHSSSTNRALLWAAKEAHLKRHGVGLARSPDTVNISRTEPGRLHAKDATGARSLLHICRLDPEHVFALATRAAPGPHAPLSPPTLHATRK